MTHGSAASVLPEEAAACLSYRKVPAAGGNIRSERGRIFLGPLAGGALVAGGGKTRIATGFMSAAVQAAKRLQLEIRGIGLNVDWIVWSPTTGQEHVIEEVYMDNAFDTIRSRGPAADLRTTEFV